jgi:hypothetical protein
MQQRRKQHSIRRKKTTRILLTTITKNLNLSRYTPWGCMAERRYSSYSFLTSALDGVSGQRKAAAEL